MSSSRSLTGGNWKVQVALPSGNLIIPGKTIPYPDFVSKCVLLIHPILTMANVDVSMTGKDNTVKKKFFKNLILVIEE